MFDVKTTEGVVTGHIARGAYMDAAIVGEAAGLEIGLERIHAFDAPRSEHRAPLVLSLDMDPATMRELVLVLAEKSDMPAFNEREWRTIADALISTAGTAADDESGATAEIDRRDRKVTGGTESIHRELAARILDAYSS